MKKVLSIILCITMVLTGAAISFAGDDEELIDIEIVIEDEEVGGEILIDPEELPNILEDNIIIIDAGDPEPEDPELTELLSIPSYYVDLEEEPQGTINKVTARRAIKKFIKNDAEQETGRGDLVNLLWTISGSLYVDYYMDFSDVDPQNPNAEALRWAAAEKIILGYGNGQSGIEDGMTTEQLAVVLYRHVKNLGLDIEKATENINTLSYDDIFEVSDWATEAVHWALAAGILQAEGGNILPLSIPSRIQAADMLTRYIEIVR